MIIGIYGAGQMGTAFALNLRNLAHQVVVYNRTPDHLEHFKHESGIQVTSDVAEFMSKLGAKKTVWLFVPFEVLDDVIESMTPHLQPGDVLIDGGNSHYRATIWRHGRLKEKGIGFIDTGISGGIKKDRESVNLMVGGDREFVAPLEKVFVEMSYEGGYAYLGPSGAGHYAKMVHNGIEYAMMSAIGEGFGIIEASPYDYDLQELASLWSNGSVLEGKLMRYTSDALAGYSEFDAIAPKVGTSGEAGWTLQESIEKHLSIPTIAAALFSRFKSTDETNISEKLVALLRRSVGGHDIYKKGE